MSRIDLRPGLEALHDFKRTWPQLLLLSLATRVAVTLFLLPGVALLLRFFLGRSDRAALSDQEILFFFLTPVGLTALVLVGGIWIGVALLEQAGLMTIGFGAIEDRRITWIDSLMYVARKLHNILLLGGHILVRVLIIAVPILALAGGVYWIFLRDHDINYYLTNRPPEFLWVAGFAALLIALLAFLLARMVLSWMLALPAVLFERRGPIDALGDSREATIGHRWTFFWWIVAWFAAGVLASSLVTWIISWVGRLVVPATSESVALVAFTIASVGLISILANLLVSFLAAVLFALIIVRLYKRYSRPGARDEPVAAAGSLAERAVVRIPSKGVLWGGAAGLAAAGLVAVALVYSIRIEDATQITAHRGAAGARPENTLASVMKAIEDGADFVEIDVQETADGEVVVFHDSDFMKVAGRALKLWEARAEDLAAIDVGSWFDPPYSGERVPTLEQVLLACKGRAKVNIELKYYGHDQDLERKVVEIVERTGMTPNVVLMSLKYDKVQKVKSLRPNWTYGLLTSVNLDNAVKLDVDFLAVNVAVATRRFIRRAHRNEKEVYVWTVNDPFQMSAMMSHGVDGIITDEPALAKRVLEIRSQMNPVQRLLVGIGSEVGAFTLGPKMVDESDA